MWDALITVGNLIFLPSLIPTLLNKNAYVPRLTSTVSFIGTSIIVVGLVGEELYASSIVLSLIGLMWLLILVVRGRQPVPSPADVGPQSAARQSAD
ncbi:MAG: hypothetical protein IH957_00665 [Chloroflexi bacterium]|nr:hypothetical protein [Chloroflexota bacterium]